MSMQMHESSPPDVSNVPRRTNWLLVAIVGLVAAALGLGAGYMLFAPSPATDVDAEVEALLDDWWAASEAGDVDALLSLLPEGGTWGSVDVMLFGVNVADTPRATMERVMATWLGRDPAPADDPMVVGEYGVFEAAQRVTGSNIDDALFVFKFGEDDGLKVIYVDAL